MTTDGKKPMELLEVVAFRAGCPLISDIRDISVSRLAKAVRATVYEDFPAEEWQAAARYLVDCGLFPSQKEVDGWIERLCH